LIGKALDHPSVVKFILDETRSKEYLVTEWVEGKTLRQILNDQGKLPPERAIAIALNICEALEYIHNKRVIHRDLKPENIMVYAGDRIKVIDFGIAGEADAQNVALGKLSSVMGTPEYISPEQVKGKPGDARSDIYAAGVMLYKMLTGITPFSGDNPLIDMNNRLIDQPTPPRAIDPSISEELQEILYRALEREPRNRYAKAHEFMWDLQHQDRVGIADRPELRYWHCQHTPWLREVLMYGSLTLTPLFVIALLLYVARNG
jgi:serine/threonine-protein kinase